ncbi:MAG: hypothetical protein JW934_15240 [Anaerolineae bacterium]|nr:hypothetical protein [Anaerolineae bacterium]
MATLSDDKTIVYLCAPDIEWVRDKDQTILVDKRGQSWSLEGIEAAAWDWLVLGYSYKDMVRFMRVAFENQTPDVAMILSHWHDVGILQAAGDDRVG